MKQTRKQIHSYPQLNGGHERGRGWRENEEGKGGQIQDDRWRLDSRWWAHKSVYSIYTDFPRIQLLESCTPETYIMWLTNDILINLILKIK